MSWLKKILPSKVMGKAGDKKVPEGLWTKCTACDAILYRAELERHLMVCPKCDHHLRLSGRDRLDIFLDPDNRQEIAADVGPTDWLKFKDSKKYKDRILAAQKKTGEKEALIVMGGTLKGMPIVAAAFDFGFIGGSMGSAVGERFVQGIEGSIANRSPFVSFATSGGARMQEGLVSLMQMSKTSAGLARLAQHKLPFISVLTDPTTGGVSASFAMLGDIIVVEPGALIGFAGPRVIQQTVRETLPEGFQRSEFLLEHGAVDMIVHRKNMRDTLSRLLMKLMHSTAKRD